MNWSDIIIAIIQLITAIFVAYLMFKYAIKQLHKESFESIERKKYEAILMAHQSIFKLLEFTSDTENPKSIMIWERGKGKKTETKYFFKKANILEFMRELPKEFYEQGNGLFLSKEVSALLFEYRSILYGFLLATKNSSEQRIEIAKPELVERMKKIHQQLSVKLRENINLKRRDLLDL